MPLFVFFEGGSTLKTLSQCIREWMDQYKRNSVKPATFDRLETSFRAMLNHRISAINISELNAEDLQEYVNEMVEDGYALSTIKKQHHLVSSYLKFANTEGIIERPFYNNVRLPVRSAVKKKQKEIESYSRTEQMRLTEVLGTNERPGYSVALLMLETGLRVGEALALEWSDILWNRRALKVDKTLIRLANRHIMEVQDGAKSFSSNRTIPLSKEAYRLLSELYEMASDKHGYIFPGRDGKPMPYEALRYQIQIACDLADVPYKGQHVFRHTFATNCYYRGCDVKILSKLLGHADVSITYNTYIHLYGDALEEMRSVIG